MPDPFLGPLFELSRSTHEKYGYSNALHPHKVENGSAHPDNPVDRDKFGVDREDYWKSRATEERNRRATRVNCN